MSEQGPPTTPPGPPIEPGPPTSPPSKPTTPPVPPAPPTRKTPSWVPLLPDGKVDIRKVAEMARQRVKEHRKRLGIDQGE